MIIEVLKIDSVDLFAVQEVSLNAFMLFLGILGNEADLMSFLNVVAFLFLPNKL